MTLSAETKLSKALALHEDVLPYIVSLNPHEFERLNNPLMRQIMPPRITLARIAAMVQMPVAELIDGIYAAAHLPAPNAPVDTPTEELPRTSAETPNWISAEVVEVVDLLESDERLDTDPFVPLFPALKRADVGEVVLMKHKWEPQPLYDVWTQLGVDFYAQQQSPDEWWIYLRKTRASYRQT